MYFLLACGIAIGASAPNHCRLFFPGINGLSKVACEKQRQEEASAFHRVFPTVPRTNNEFQCLWFNEFQVDGFVIGLASVTEERQAGEDR